MPKIVACENSSRCPRKNVIIRHKNKNSTRKNSTPKKSFFKETESDNSNLNNNNNEKEDYNSSFAPSLNSSDLLFQTKARSEARLKAEMEDEKLIQEKFERAEKLQKFQADVRKRVSTIQKMKQQKEIEQGMKDMTIARNVMRSCVGLSTSAINPQKFLVSLKQTSPSPPEDAKHNNSLSSQSQEILTPLYQNNIIYNPKQIPEKASLSSSWSDYSSPYIEPTKIICEDKQPPDMNYLITGGMREKNFLHKVPENPCFGSSKNHIVSKLPTNSSEFLENKKYQTLQRSLSRKVFMDMEREQTREVERQNRQKMELFLLRNTREAIRKEVETSVKEPVFYSEVEIFQDPEDFEPIPKSENDFPKHSLHKVSYTRKLLALMQILEEKCLKNCIPVPSLCPCGTSSSDPLRNSCANNCRFYKNPAEYCRAVKCLISSMEESRQPRPFLT